tara:strand:+ start:2213 stop:2536 length:324 start_codon:yes stop_codon:yes gene_type:complete
MLIISIHPMCLLVNYVETPFRLLMKKYLLLLKLLLFLLQDLYSRYINCTTGGRAVYIFIDLLKFLHAIINSISIALHLEHHTHSIVKTTSQKMPTKKKEEERKGIKK